MNPANSTGASGKSHPDTQSWDSPPKTGLSGMGSYWQDDVNVEVTLLLGTEMKGDVF